MEQNKKFFWIVCFLTVVVGLYWSARTLLQQANGMGIAFLAINVVCAVAVTVCFFFDRKIKKDK